MGTPARGRPRTFDRDAALTAATHLFWERGYHATALSDLTTAMGIRSASLYQAFGDKQALFREAVATYAAVPGADFVTTALAQEPTARTAFARILRDAAHFYSDPSHPPGCLVITAATNITPQDTAVEEYLRGLRRANLEIFRDRLTTAAHDGELPAGTDTTALADYFAVVVQGMSQRARDGIDTAALAAVAELAMAAWPARSRTTTDHAGEGRAHPAAVAPDRITPPTADAPVMPRTRPAWQAVSHLPEALATPSDECRADM
ncbi:TetR/AcrR family transcriptional regulator [Nocardia sp. alder85J]|uniref:TetR/AcrR family transcriptional regulator n=1 Tax=Nocardia sp. alder85J TaxID=2862949 RepID=UPI001CD23E2C|nr:TetR/AcrR family transcriptional regulator [Nocardia sp. alder85J]MCX4098660.1 TetR/AcrR family transcriptional regulator [Nocardia sp. alder85J]